MKNIETKLERLRRWHRQNVWHDDIATADRHCRALHRLGLSKTFKAMAERNRQEAEHRKSERLLSTYA